MSSPNTVLISANDPGGANAVVPVAKALMARGSEIQSIVTGPALEIFRKAGIPSEDGSLYSDDDIIREISSRKPAVFLAGTSIGESVDKRAFRFLGTIPSVYVIDFWSHYGHRFTEAKSDLSHIPTRICVVDERMCEEMLREGFPESSLVITGNPHFDHFTDGITREGEDRTRVLFISQPIRHDAEEKDAPECGFDEFTVLDAVIAHLPSSLQLSIRLHPRDDVHKYDEYIGERVSIASESALEEALSHSGLVVGMFSPVLMQAAFAGKPTISFQPGLIGEDSLPTNALGITKRAADEQALAELFGAHVAGKNIVVPTHKAVFPKGSCERVLAVVDSVRRP